MAGAPWSQCDRDSGPFLRSTSHPGKDVHIPHPGNWPCEIFNGQRDFAAVMKLRISKWTNIITGVFKRRTQGIRQVEGGDMTREAEGNKAASHGAMSQGMWAAPGSWKRQRSDFSPGNSRRNIAVPTPGFSTSDLQSSRTTNVNCLKTPSLRQAAIAATGHWHKP